MAVSAGDRIARQVAFTLEKKSDDIFENIFLNNGILAALGSSGRVKVVKGGDEFHERTHLGQNSNVGFRSKFAVIPSAFQNNFLTAKYGQATISGSVPINLVEEDQNASPQRIGNTSATEDLVEELMLTYPNKVSDALMAAASGANDPESIVETIEATAYGSQTSTTGGISRANYPGTDPEAAWQNQYNSTGIADVGSAAGKAALVKFAWDCSPGGSAVNQQPNIGLTTTGVISKMSGGGDNLRRYSVDGKMLKLGFDNFLINNAAVMADRNVTAGYLYFMNTKYMRMQILAGPKSKTIGNVKTIGDGKQSIPLQVRPPIESDNYLNYIIKAYLTLNVTWGGLRQHGLQTTITEA